MTSKQILQKNKQCMFYTKKKKWKVKYFFFHFFIYLMWLSINNDTIRELRAQGFQCVCMHVCLHMLRGFSGLLHSNFEK